MTTKINIKLMIILNINNHGMAPGATVFFVPLSCQLLVFEL